MVTACPSQGNSNWTRFAARLTSMTLADYGFIEELHRIFCTFDILNVYHLLIQIFVLCHNNYSYIVLANEESQINHF